MKVVISSVGRFRFDLARQLNRMGYLERIFTGYPMWKVDDDLREKTSSFPWVVTPQMALYRYGYQNIADRLSLPATHTLDHWVASRLPNCDVFVGLSQSGLYTIRAAKKRGIKTVCERSSSHIVAQNEILIEEHQRQNIPFKGIAQWAIEKELQEYAEADLIKVPSTFAYETFIQHQVPKQKLVIVPLGADLRLFHPLSKEDRTFRILYAGMMSARKGVVYLLQAMANVKYPDVETLLLGSILNEFRPALRKYAGAFRYGGVVPRAKLSWYYSQASVFVMPSVEEGLATVMAQAMACGVPVIATANSGAKDLFTDGVEGFIVPIRAPDAIQEKIQFLYENPIIREQMAHAALRRVQSMGGWDEHGKRAVEAFRTLLQN